MNNSSHLWGEIDEDCQYVTNAIPLMIAPAAHVTCHVPTVEVPTSDKPPSEKARQVVSGGPNIILHILQLQRHVADMRQMIVEAHSKMDMSQFGEVELPQTIKRPTRYSKGTDQSNQLDSCGPRKRLKLQEVELSPASLQAQLRRGVATVCVLVGYENSSNRALDILCSVLAEFLKKFCTLLRFNSDNKESLPAAQYFVRSHHYQFIDNLFDHTSQSYHGLLKDAVERSLLDCGIGGREAIHQYWQKEVCGRARQLSHKADNLQQEYQQLMEPTVAGPERSAIVDTLLPPLSVTTTMPDDSSQSQEEELSLDAIPTQPAVAMEVPDTPFKSPEFGAFSQFTDHDTDMSIVMRAVNLPKKRTFSSVTM
ncbi:uncharacterized protein [Dysidea avara]|uniref:uncharacterized protein isoform X2 n=1 Tax=Dysidea avara TaxID=196820 RepID=UPI0033226ADE